MAIYVLQFLGKLVFCSGHKSRGRAVTLGPNHGPRLAMIVTLVQSPITHIPVTIDMSNPRGHLATVLRLSAVDNSRGRRGG